MRKISVLGGLFVIGLSLMLLIGGASPASAGEVQPESTLTAAGWDEASHGKDAEPDYEVVFPQDAVNRIEITLSAESWSALQAEMTEQFGEQGTGEDGMGGGFPGIPGDFGDRNPPEFPEGSQPPGGEELFQRQDGGAPVQRPMGGNPPALDMGETSYVTATVTFEGQTWEHIGFRYSGNSTLQTSWRSGTNKISFRLDFDEYEDDFPETEDQRFFGFKQISFKSNAMDSSYLREKVTADIFREAGVASPQTAFYEVYIDYGEGLKYYGLYTAVEIVEDTLIKTQFSDGSGNVYKPEGSGAAFVEGTFSEDSFEKQTNAEEKDWSDIQVVFAALHSELRTSDPAAWRSGLESVFDTDAFIRWLAVDTILQNWDTYGAMAHNYYLYTDPADGLVTWIPWDNNMALSAGGMGPGGGRQGEERGGFDRGGRSRGTRALDLTGVGEEWPLIRLLMDDPVYLEAYQQSLEETIQGAFQPQKLAATYQAYHDLIAPSVQAEVEGYTQLDSIDSFEQSVAALIQHSGERFAAVQEYLSAR